MAQAKITPEQFAQGYTVNQNTNTIVPPTTVIPVNNPVVPTPTPIKITPTPIKITPEQFAQGYTVNQNNNTVVPPITSPKIENVPQNTNPIQTQTTEVKNTPTGTITTNTTPVDKNARSMEIYSNLEKAYNDQASLAKGLIDKGDFEAYKKIYSSTNPDEAKVVDAYFQAKQPKDAGGIYNILKTGQKIYNTAIQNSPEMSKAQARFDLSNKYQGMGADQLYNAYVNGEIGSQLEQDIATNPNIAIAKAKYEKKQSTDQINEDAKNVLDVWNKNNGKEITTDSKSSYEKIIDKILTGLSDTSKTDIPKFNEYMATNYPEIVTKTTELNAKNTLIKQKADERDNRLDEIIKENPGISINRATMLAARQNKDLNNEIKTLSYEIGNLQADVNFQTSMADKSYGYDLQEQQRQDFLNAEARGYAMDYAKIEDTRTYNEQQKAKDLKNKFDYDYGDLTSTNPQVQKTAALRMAKSIQDQYKGMPFRRTVDVMANDIVNQINSGMTTEQITTDITNAIQNAPDYTNWKANNTALQSPNIDMKPFSVSEGSSVYDPKTGKFITVPTSGTTGTGTSGINIQPTGTTVGINYTNSSGTTKKLVVDSVAQDSLITALNSMGNKVIVGDTLRTTEQQTKLYDDYIAGKGGLASKPGTSLHEKGMAIDIYGGTDKNGKLTAPTASQIKIMNDNGWFQTAGLGDKGHFEYKGAKSDLKNSYIERMKVGGLTNSEYGDIQKIANQEGWLPEYNEALKKGIKSNLTPTQQKAYETMVDDITKSASYTNMTIFQNGVAAVKSGLSQGNGLGDIEAINAFQRMVDPGATVREGDVSLIQSAIPLTGKYSWDYLYGKLKSGDKLPKDVRNQLNKAATDLYNIRLNIYNDSSVPTFKTRAAGIGVDLNMVPGLNFKKETINTSQGPVSSNVTSITNTLKSSGYSDSQIQQYLKLKGLTK